MPAPRNRRPRVNITVDDPPTSRRGRKGLPFTIGVLADLSGHGRDRLPRFREREFVAVSEDTLPSLIRAVEPRLSLRVPNRLADDASELQVDLRFRSTDDFGPEAIADQVPALRSLTEARQRLREAAAQLARRESACEVIEAVLNNPAALAELARELGVTPQDMGTAS